MAAKLTKTQMKDLLDVLKYSEYGNGRPANCDIVAYTWSKANGHRTSVLLRNRDSGKLYYNPTGYGF